MMTEWVRIYGDPDNRPLPGCALWFHERWLPGFLGRLGSRYQVRRARLPPGAVVAVGAIAAAPLHLTVPKAPACFPGAGAFARA